MSDHVCSWVGIVMFIMRLSGRERRFSFMRLESIFDEVIIIAGLYRRYGAATLLCLVILLHFLVISHRIMKNIRY